MSEFEIDGHRITLLRNGEAYFPALLAALAEARETIYLETYIFADDETGARFHEALQQAARRGVNTHVLLDGFGAADFPHAWARELRAAGVQLLWFRPQISWLTLRRERLRRLHRKLVLVDGKVAFIGGINIINDLPDDGSTDLPRLDYSVRIEGAAIARSVDAAMRRLWTLISWTNFRSRGDRERIPTLPLAPTSTPLSLVVRDNLRHRSDIEQAYLNEIWRAQDEIIIANAYFLPGYAFRSALLEARKRGVRVVLLLQGRVDHRLQHYASLSLYGQLLKGGIEIFQYHASFLHAKVAVIDRQWATVGSSNIDPFSLWLAREANLLVRDASFAEALRDDLQAHIRSGAHAVRLSAWGSLGLWPRFLMRASYILVRALVGLTGYMRRTDRI